VTDPIRFKVYGTPIPQGSLRAFKDRRGNARVSQGGSDDGKRKLGDWRQAIGEEARRALPDDAELLTGPVYVTVSFLVPKPKSAPKYLRHVTKKPDLDRLLRALLDAITGVLIVDDAQVVSISAAKSYAIECRPHADVLVMAAPEDRVVPAAEPSARGAEQPALI
jgi:crossover junction endodeoxyribonuclease RusA